MTAPPMPNASRQPTPAGPSAVTFGVPTLDLPCRDVFTRGQRVTEVVGPLLGEEAEASHDDVWSK